MHSDEQKDTTEPQKFPCEKCEAELTTIQDIEKHNELHFQAENLSLAFHVSRVCNKVVSSKELKIQCSKCIHIFHKKCTNKKDARGNWKSSLWSCSICSPPNTTLSIPSPNLEKSIPLIERQTEEGTNLNPDANIFLPETIKLPHFSGKHRKSKVNEKPETEFLQATVDTLKASIAKNGLEIKKLKESNDVKTKRSKKNYNNASMSNLKGRIKKHR